jgi:glycine betaine/proline transport system substrate-binding protein
MKKLLVLLMTAVMVLSLAACATEEKKIILGEGDWDSNAFHDQVVKIIAEAGYGYEVEIVMADTAVMIAGMGQKDIDAVLELWSDNVPTYQDDLAAGKYVELATNFDDNMQGLYVPTYLIEGPNAVAPDLKTVQDLMKYPEIFPDPEDGSRGIIYGGPEGWGATAHLHKKMAQYGLEEAFNFRPIDSNATLSATLAGAYEKGEPWVGYNWEPTWIMGLYDMTLLEDSSYSAEDFENGVGAFASVNVTVCANADFEEKHPELTEVLKNYTTSSALTSSGLAYMQENGVEADAAAKWFISENPDLIKGMVTADAFDKIMEAVQQ